MVHEVGCYASLYLQVSQPRQISINAHSIPPRLNACNRGRKKTCDYLVVLEIYPPTTLKIAPTAFSIFFIRTVRSHPATLLSCALFTPSILPSSRPRPLCHPAGRVLHGTVKKSPHKVYSYVIDTHTSYNIHTGGPTHRKLWGKGRCGYMYVRVKYI